MWESEHGPSGEAHAPAGASTGNDEINRIVKGGNYGWPTVAGDQTAPGMRNPVAHAPNSPAWAPGGLAIGPDRIMYAPFLAGTELRAFSISGDGIAGQATLFDGTYGRMRAATADRTHLWLTTSNNTNDEKVLRVPFDPASIAAPAATCASARRARKARRPADPRPAAQDRARRPVPPGQGPAVEAGAEAGQGVQATPARRGAARRAPVDHGRAPGDQAQAGACEGPGRQGHHPRRQARRRDDQAQPQEPSRSCARPRAARAGSS